MNLQPFGIENNSPLTAHTLDADRLNGGWVLDAGARGFEFARDMAARGCKVLSLDASCNVKDPGIEGVTFLQMGLAGLSGARHFQEIGDGSGSCIVGHPRTGSYEVYCTTVEELMQNHGIEMFDAVKLDIESEEFNVLARWPGPVARQINVSFHDFAFPPVKRSQLAEEARNRLKSWYVPVQDQASERHGHSIPCHWDSLFVLKP